MKVGPQDLNSGAGNGVFFPQHEHEKSDCRCPPPCGPLVHFWTDASLSVVSAACRRVVTSLRYRYNYFVSDSCADCGASTSNCDPCEAGCRQQLRYIYIPAIWL